MCSSNTCGHLDQFSTSRFHPKRVNRDGMFVSCPPSPSHHPPTLGWKRALCFLFLLPIRTGSPLSLIFLTPGQMVEGIFFLCHGGQFALWPSPWHMLLLRVKFRKLFLITKPGFWELSGCSRKLFWVSKLNVDCFLLASLLLLSQFPLWPMDTSVEEGTGEMQGYANDTISKSACFRVLSHYIYLDIL